MGGGKSASQDEILIFCRRYVDKVALERGFSDFQLKDDDHLIRNGFMDSIDILEFMSVLEDQFDVEFDLSEEDPDKILTIQALATYCSH
ncbi:MAG: acyl carrier protein [Desulfovibrionaceae bacterium]